jgi:hypothetical protein
VLAIDVVAPPLRVYGLRLTGVNQWRALVLCAAVPLLRLTVTVATQRRRASPSLFSLSLIGCGTAIGLLTADPGCWCAVFVGCSVPLDHHVTSSVIAEARRGWGSW